MKSNAVEGGVLFSELDCGIEYFSTDKHQLGEAPRSKTDPSIWRLARPDEAAAFSRAAAASGYVDSGGNIWFVDRADGRLLPLGKADEKLALFQKPSAGSEYWHGHPRGHRGREDYPDTPTLRALRDACIISKVEYVRLVDGSIP